MKVLNLYAGIGGNRKLWKDVEVTAVEHNEEIAGIYSEYFPQDKMIVGDAHEYLSKHYKEFDFIWSSPPCQTHSRARFWGSKGNGKTEEKYPDMKLYQEIIFLKKFTPASCRWVIENVVPYYEPLITPDYKVDKHIFWSNFLIRDNIHFEYANSREEKIKQLEEFHNITLEGKKLSTRKTQVLRNTVNPDLGLYILEQARGVIREQNVKQNLLFN